MPTNLELKMVHVAARQAGLGEEQYRMVLRNAGGVASSKELTQAGLEDVMSVFEDGGFRHQGKPENYWRNKVAMRGTFCGDRLAHKIAELAARQQYALEGLCRRVSGERVGIVARLTPREALNLVELLKAVIERKTTGEEAETMPAVAPLQGEMA